MSILINVALVIVLAVMWCLLAHWGERRHIARHQLNDTTAKDRA